MENQDNNNNNKTDYLFELIQNIQSKMDSSEPNNNIHNNSSSNSNNIEQTNENNNFLNDINNLLNNFSNTNDNSSNGTLKQDDNANFDLNSILKNIDFSNIASTINENSNNNETNESENGFNFDNLQNILGGFTRKDPRKELLLALKPFLRQSRQDKINEYIGYLTIGSALGIFNKKENRGD